MPVTRDYVTIEDLLWDAIQGRSVWAAERARDDIVEMLRDTLVEWLREAEGRALEFDHEERAEQIRVIKQLAEELP